MMVCLQMNDGVFVGCCFYCYMHCCCSLFRTSHVRSCLETLEIHSESIPKDILIWQIR